MIPSADPADRPDPVHGLPLGTSPTHAGGQDDMSLNKLPQITFWVPMRREGHTHIKNTTRAQSSSNAHSLTHQDGAVKAFLQTNPTETWPPPSISSSRNQLKCHTFEIYGWLRKLLAVDSAPNHLIAQRANGIAQLSIGTPRRASISKNGAPP